MYTSQDQDTAVEYLLVFSHIELRSYSTFSSYTPQILAPRRLYIPSHHTIGPPALLCASLEKMFCCENLNMSVVGLSNRIIIPVSFIIIQRSLFPLHGDHLHENDFIRLRVCKIQNTAIFMKLFKSDTFFSGGGDPYLCRDHAVVIYTNPVT